MGNTVNRIYSKEEAIEKILIKQNEIGCPLKQSDFANPSEDEIGMGTIRKYWGSFNKMKLELELDIIQESMMDKNKTNEEMLEDLQNFINELGRLPTSYEINNNPNIHNRGSYNNRFGGISDAFKLLGYIPNKKAIGFHTTNDEIIEIYKEFIDEIGYVPSFEFCKQIYKLPSPVTVLRRFGCKWNDFIKMLGYKPNKKIATTNICNADDGTICFSSSECYIHNLLLTKDIIELKKETLYRDIIESNKAKEKCGYKRFDWTFVFNNKLYLMEYFGIMSNKNYKLRHDEKLEIIYLDNKKDNFIALYPNDIKQIENILSFIPNKTIYKGVK